MCGAVRQNDYGDPETWVSDGDLPDRPRDVPVQVIDLPALDDGRGPCPRRPAHKQGQKKKKNEGRTFFRPGDEHLQETGFSEGTSVPDQSTNVAETTIDAPETEGFWLLSQECRGFF